ncbi:hypothetical protein BN12_440002 [Nostocoides japonicum T1-X7]|uniref:DUF2332 domain-containing protein n=1 Tax=Nostocoides japonicum T1-X7 TaxID=1194083 RepID=A0A077LZM8_9MICO|nr:hypothetical protein BN12_440002 [Tetrasphaera japonica T1-X7]
MPHPSPSSPTLAEQFRGHFADSGTLYEVLLDRLADDLDAGGLTATICAGWERAAPTEVVQLRLLAAIFRVVLRGDAPQLVRFYPCLGGTAPPRDAWETFEPVVADHAGELRAALEVAPQTNEVGRSAPLVVALFEAVRRTGLHRVRLLELGASAGLNLNVDRYRLAGPGWASGPEDSVLEIDTRCAGVRPSAIDVVERPPRVPCGSGRSSGPGSWSGTRGSPRPSTSSRSTRSPSTARAPRPGSSLSWSAPPTQGSSRSSGTR